MLDIIGHPAWQVFAILGIALSIAEIVTPGFVMLPIGLGFLLAAALVSLVDGPALTWLILAVCLTVVFLVFQKWARKNAKLGGPVTGIERLLGQHVQLVESISKQQPGRIKVSGDVFFAVSGDGSEIAAPCQVAIARFDGNKAVVIKV